MGTSLTLDFLGLFAGCFALGYGGRLVGGEHVSVWLLSLAVDEHISGRVDVLLLDFDSTIAKAVPGNQATLFDDFTSLFSLVDVVHQLGEVAEELTVAEIGLAVLLSMSSDIMASKQCLLDFTIVDRDHEVDLVQLANEELVFDAHALKLSHGDGVCAVLETLLCEQDVNNLDLGLQPEEHVRMLASWLSFDDKS